MTEILDGPSAEILAHSLAEQLATRADEADRRAELPAADVALLRESGYLTLSVPREFGGHGLSLRDCVAAHMTLAQGSAATAMVAGMQLHMFGHEREVGNWLPGKLAWLSIEAAEGGLFNAVASEPQMGSPSRGGLPATSAESVPDGFCINGHKTWVTGGRHLTHMLVRAAHDGEMVNVLVEGDRAGISWRETWRDALSLRASESHDLLLENVAVPAENLVQQGTPPRRPSVWFPMIMSAVYLGAAIAARNRVIQFALERVPTALGKPIATLPKIQRQIGEIDVALQAAKALLLEVSAEWQGDNAMRDRFMPRVAAAKVMVTTTANQVTDQALQVAGGSAITSSLPLERYFRDVRAGAMQPPSGDTALELVGRAAIDERDR